MVDYRPPGIGAKLFRLQESADQHLYMKDSTAKIEKGQEPKYEGRRGENPAQSVLADRRSCSESQDSQQLSARRPFRLPGDEVQVGSEERRDGSTVLSARVLVVTAGFRLRDEIGAAACTLVPGAVGLDLLWKRIRDRRTR